MLKASLMLFVLVQLWTNFACTQLEQRLLWLRGIDQCTVTVVLTEPTSFEIFTTESIQETPKKFLMYKPTYKTGRSHLKAYKYKHYLPSCETVFIQAEDYDAIWPEEFAHFLQTNQNFKHDRFVFFKSTEKGLRLPAATKNSWLHRLKYVSWINDGTVEHERKGIHNCKLGHSSQCVRQQLTGQHLKATTLLIEPYIMLRNKEPVGGYFYEILRKSAKHYNFTYDLECPVFKGTVQLPNGTFLGPMGEVVSGEKDLVLGSAQTLERHPYMDFPTYADFTELQFVTSYPKKILRWEAILFIFPFGIWMLLCVSCGIMLPIFYLFIKRRKHVSSDVKSQSLSAAALFGACVVTFCPLLEQDSRCHPVSFARRLVVFLWMMNCMNLTNFYKSDFIAYVTLPKKEKIPETFKELSQNPDYTIKFMYLNAAGTVFFNRTTNPMYISFRKRFIWEKNKLRCLESASFDPKTACIGFEMINAVQTSKNLTLRKEFLPYRYSKDSALTLIMNTGFTKGSKYVDSFSQIVGYLRDTGNIKKWKSEAYDIRRLEGAEWLKSKEGQRMKHKLKDHLRAQNESGVLALGIKNIFCGLLLFLGGIIISLIGFLVEKCVTNWKELSIEL